jgi:hypothetical protein
MNHSSPTEENMYFIYIRFVVKAAYSGNISKYYTCIKTLSNYYKYMTGISEIPLLINRHKTTHWARTDVTQQTVVWTYISRHVWLTLIQHVCPDFYLTKELLFVSLLTAGNVK